MSTNKKGSDEGNEFLDELNSFLDRGLKFLDILQKRNFEDGARTLDRYFTTKESADLVGVTTAAIYKAEEEGRLKKPELKETKRGKGFRKIRKGYQFEDIIKMREVFGTLPWRDPDTDECAVIAFANFKGGCWKTTSSVMMAQYYALQGYRVLVIDADPQATASLEFGFIPDYQTDYENSIGPWLLSDNTEGLHKCVRNTHWPNIDIICSALGLFEVEMSISSQIGELNKEAEMNNSRSEIPNFYNFLKEGVDDLKKDYDMIILDGTPSLGILSMNVVVAADILIIPVPAQVPDLVSSLQFIRMLSEYMSIYQEEYEIELPIPYFLITKYSSDDDADFMAQQIRQVFRTSVFKHHIAKSTEIGKGNIAMRTIYERNATDLSTKKTYDRAQKIFEQVFDEILDYVIKPSWPSKHKELKERGLL